MLCITAHNDTGSLSVAAEIKENPGLIPLKLSAIPSLA